MISQIAQILRWQIWHQKVECVGYIKQKNPELFQTMRYHVAFVETTKYPWMFSNSVDVHSFDNTTRHFIQYSVMLWDHLISITLILDLRLNKRLSK